jgi:hypothetical protein
MPRLWYEGGATAKKSVGGRLLSSFEQPLLGFAKISALLSAVWTALCAVLLIGWQVTSWLYTGVWDAYPLSSVVNSLKSDGGNTYITASSAKIEPELTTTQEMVDWLLEIPTIVALLIALSLLLAFHRLVKIIEINRTTN